MLIHSGVKIDFLTLKVITKVFIPIYGDNITETYFGDYFTVYTNIDPYVCTSETNNVICHYTSKQKQKQPYDILGKI